MNKAVREYFKFITQPYTLLYAAVCLILLVAMLILPASRTGDSNEYFLMTESFLNHGTPELRQIDIDDYYTDGKNPFNEKIPPKSGFYKANNSQWYSYHFWMYSAMGALSQIIFELVDVHPQKSLQFTNALLCVFALVVINFFTKLTNIQKMIFTSLFFFSPILWTVHRAQTELYIIVFVTVAIAFQISNKYTLSILSAVMASFQNQMFGVFVVYLMLYAAYKNHWRIKSALYYASISSIIMLPYLFYYYHFGKFSLLTKHLSYDVPIVRKVLELFFDLNMGVFPYFPVLFLLTIVIIIYKLGTLRKEFILEYQWCIVILIISIYSSFQVNWNNDCAGVARYAVWFIPFVIFLLVLNYKWLMSNEVMRLILIIGIFVQVLITYNSGFIVPVSYLDHSPAAKLVLNTIPAIYEPSKEIFCERTIRREGPYDKCMRPAIYLYEGVCTKALATCAQIEEVIRKCGNVSINLTETCPDMSDNVTAYYINYK